MATHVAVLLGFALTLRYTTLHHQAGAPVDTDLQVNFVSESSDPTSAADEMQFARSSGSDEASEREEISEAPLGSAQPRPSLADVLREQSSVDLAGVLPKADDVIGAGSPDGDRLAVATSPGKRRRGGGRATSGIGKARTGVFGLEGEGYKFVYVFDRSASMDGYKGAPLGVAKTQLLASLDDLGTTHQFQVIFYNDKPHVFSPTGVAGRLVFGTDQNKALARQFIGSIIGSGATEHEKALKLAMAMAPDVIFFLTDAGDPRLDSRQLADIGRLNRGTSINTIEYGYGPQVDSDNFLVRLAQANGGKHVYVDISQFESTQ